MHVQQIGLWAGIGVLLGGVFMADVRMELGFTPWQLYVIPLGLTFWSALLYAPLLVAVLCTMLTMVGFHLSPPLVPESMAVINRLFGVVMFWGLGVLIVAYKQLALRLSCLTEQLSVEIRERTQDLGRVVDTMRIEEGRRQELASEREGTLDHTREELERLGRRLEELQRSLLNS